MISITAGPMIKKYAAIYVQQLDFDIDEAIDEVIKWANAYVHGPWPDSLLPHLEDTEELRWESLKKYIKNQVDNSVTGRIKADIERKAA